MQFDINRHKVNKAVDIILKELSQAEFNQGEVLIASAEVIGRIVVSLCDNPVQLRECAEVVQNHFLGTITAGAMAKGIPTDTTGH